ncbi:MAG: orotate phosphoribosyltransferase [Thermus sp.]|uniref:orotate phosphoribosyltransferase n=1 Tax=unclassified Thermus TaxID=2619321 RepID=UPI0002389183|nr:MULTISPECIES: orotate phosphoribosyltransferase [unclassified Thermus]AEV16994.1 Orotate phosphoribosyltransferase [Thermus sp. CCB_US3_UF1]MCS6869550.1 orotate phosphoribosyltransferase [Thermus sp.]MCS7219325.1 orotate phosphoribosyltransferase [Thermus sp.]MCX7850441.1 orotate phosphoribosyltransferase [Thermus sp.]MDW8018107.1 orotate phosphoribosyltransferase [Thermus sp.]
MEVLDLYRRTGALLEGHFLLRSGLHSPLFLQSAALLQHPLYAEAVGEALGRRFEEERVDFVIGPALGGVVLAFVVAKALGARALFAEKDGQGGMTLRKGLTVNPGDRFLAVEDVVTTGESVRKAIRAAEARGGVLVGVGAIVDRSGGGVAFGVPFQALLRLEVPQYAPGACPLCRAGVPLEEV